MSNRYKRLFPLPLKGYSERSPRGIDPSYATNWRNLRTHLDNVELAPGLSSLAPATSKSINIGEFQYDGSGMQVISHGLTAAPSLIIFWGSAHNSSHGALFEDFGDMFIGVADSSIANTVYMCGVTPPAGGNTTESYHSLSRCIKFLSPGEAHVTAFGASTFDLTWDVAPPDNPRFINFIAFDGNADASFVNHTVAARGAQTIVPGTAGTPQLAIFLAAGTTAGASDSRTDRAMMSIGAATSPTQKFSSNVYTNGITTPNFTGSELTGSYAFLTHTDEAFDPLKFFTTSLTSFGANQVNVNFSVGGASTTTQMTVIAIGGLDAVEVGLMDIEPVAAAGTWRSFPLANTSLKPEAIMFTGHVDYAPWFGGFPPITPEMRATFGAGRPGNNRSAGMTADVDASSIYVRRSSHRERSILVLRPSNDPSNYYQVGRVVGMSEGAFTELLAVATPAHTSTGYIAIGPVTTTGAPEVPRTYTQVFGGYGAANETILSLTNKSAWKLTGSTSPLTLTATGESYTMDNESHRYAVAGIQDRVAWTALGVNCRYWNGTTFGQLITSGTNHSARLMVAFNDRLVTAYTQHTGSYHPRQIRWCANGLPQDWASRGSGVAEVAETSIAPLTGFFVLGERAYLSKATEIVELIPTGTLDPVFRQSTRWHGTGFIAPWSIATTESFAFGLGGDSVYVWDGSSFQDIGTEVYRDIGASISTHPIDVIQGITCQYDSVYILIVRTASSTLNFVYDYKLDRWYKDFYGDISAAGVIRTDDQLNRAFFSPAGQVIVFGSDTGETNYINYNLTSILGSDPGSYLETVDIPAQAAIQTSRGTSFVDDLSRANTLFAVRFEGRPGDTFVVEASRDRGTTWTRGTGSNDFNTYTDSVGIGADGVGISYFNFTYRVLRLRFSFAEITLSESDAYGDIRLEGVIQLEWSEAGDSDPDDVPPTNPSAI